MPLEKGVPCREQVVKCISGFTLISWKRRGDLSFKLGTPSQLNPNTENKETLLFVLSVSIYYSITIYDLWGEGRGGCLQVKVRRGEEFEWWVREL